MADNVITPEFRAAFVGLFKATAPKDNPNGAKKYSIRAVFMPDADLSSLKQQAKNAAEEKWGAGKVPKTVRSPFRFNEELENPIPGIPDDAVVMTFSANEDRRPGVVDKNLQDIIDDAECYSGAWFRAQVRAYAYDQAGNKGTCRRPRMTSRWAKAASLPARRLKPLVAARARQQPECSTDALR
jgi:Protein of unknown function (DUF2815)